MTLKTISLLQAVILVTYLTVCQTRRCGCPKYWDEVKGKCFRFFESENVAFTDAKQFCEDIKVTCPGKSEDVTGTLARIPCLAMQQQLEGLAKEKTLTGDYYIGLTIDGKRRESWVSGDPRGSYKAWATDIEEIQANSRVVMSFNDCNNFGKWRPVNVNYNANYLCMLPCVVDTINE